MRCFECGAGKLQLRELTLTGERNGEPFAVLMEGYHCDNCGFETIDSTQSEEFARLVSDAYRTAHGLLTSREIHESRLMLSMSQQAFADYLGVGVASIKRWESGQIQDKAMDQLMRIKTNPEAAWQNLRRVERQVPSQRIISSLVGVGGNVEMDLVMADPHVFFDQPLMAQEPVVFKPSLAQPDEDLLAA